MGAGHPSSHTAPLAPSHGSRPQSELPSQALSSPAGLIPLAVFCLAFRPGRAPPCPLGTLVEEALPEDSPIPHMKGCGGVMLRGRRGGGLFMGAQASCLKTQGRAQDTLPEGQQERIQPDNPERSNPGLQPGAACPLGRDGPCSRGTGGTVGRRGRRARALRVLGQQDGDHEPFGLHHACQMPVPSGKPAGLRTCSTPHLGRTGEGWSQRRAKKRGPHCSLLIPLSSPARAERRVQSLSEPGGENKSPLSSTVPPRDQYSLQD